MRSRSAILALTGALALLACVVWYVSTRPPRDTGHTPTPPDTHSNARAADTRTFRGRVLSPDGEPVRDVPVRVRGWSAKSLVLDADGSQHTWIDLATTSRPDGRFELSFSSPVELRYSLEIRPAYFVACAWSVQSLPAGGERDLGDIRLERGATITGKLVDAHARPLFGRWTANVRRTGQRFNGDRIEATATSIVDLATGAFTLDNVPAGRVFPYAASSLDWTVTGAELELHAGETTHVELSFDGPDLSRRIAVVVAADPFPYAAPRVSGMIARGPGGERELVREQNGAAFSIEDLEPGDYTLAITDPAFEPWSASGIRAGTLTNVRVRSSGSLALRVLDRDTNAPVDDCEALVHYVDKPWTEYWQPLVAAEPRTPGESVFTGLPAGDLELIVRAQGRAEWKQRVAALANGERRELTVTLSPGAIVSGRVVDSDGRTPMSGVEVWLERTDEPANALPGIHEQCSRRTAETTADGRFRFDQLPHTVYRVTALHGLFVVSDSLAVTREQTDSSGDVELTLPPWGRVHGRVRGPSAEALTDLRMSIRPLDLRSDDENRLSELQFHAADRLTSEVRGDGTFTSGPLLAGPCVAALKLPNFDIRGGNSWGAAGAEIALGTLEVHAGEDRSVEFEADFAGPGRLDIRVDSDASIGGQFAVEVRNTDPNSSCVGMGSTDAAGTLRLGPLLAGDYWVAVSPFKTSLFYVHPHAVRVESLRETRVDVALTCWPAALAVRDANGPVASSALYLKCDVAADRFFEALVFTDANGVLHTSLPAGKWRLARESEHWTQSAAERTAAEERRPRVEFEWTKDGPVPPTVTLPP